MKKLKLSSPLLAVLIIVIALEAIYLFLPSLKIQKNQVRGEQKLKSCQKLNDPSLKIQCAEEAIKKILSEEGTSTAFEAVAQISELDPNLKYSCHDFAHEIGQYAYKLFRSKTGFEINPKITICNFGFYHGFMEALVLDTGDYQKARDFCEYINKQLVAHGLNLNEECYHGIGHGTVDSHNSQEWLQPDSVSKKALTLCKTIATTDQHLSDCASGVFNGIANTFTSGQYGLQVNEQDPFWICNEQEDIIQNVCFGLMSRTLLTLTKGDFQKALEIAQKVAPQGQIERVISNITVIYAISNTDEKSFPEVISACRLLKESTSLACMKGYSIGLLQSGQPQLEYQQPLKLCNSLLLTKNEKNTCFESFLPKLKNYYTSDKVKQICESLDGMYRPLCTESES